MVVPQRVPMQKNGAQNSLAAVSLEVQSGASDGTPYEILNERGAYLGFKANRQEWSKKLSEALAQELARRGAMVRVSAALKLTVAVESITMSQSDMVTRFNVQARAASSGGWSKGYQASSETGAGAFESADSIAGRLAGQTLAGVIKAILDDPEFLSQINRQATAAPAKQ